MAKLFHAIMVIAAASEARVSCNNPAINFRGSFYYIFTRNVFICIQVDYLHETLLSLTVSQPIAS